jgi:hypothetical protein
VSAELEPRLTYSCPQCGQRIVRVFTAAQLGTDLPAAVHRGLQPGEHMSPLTGTQVTSPGGTLTGSGAGLTGGTFSVAAA